MRINLTLASLLLAFTAFAQVDPVDKSGVAIGGFDVVAYFKEGIAKKALLSSLLNMKEQTIGLSRPKTKGCLRQIHSNTFLNTMVIVRFP